MSEQRTDNPAELPLTTRLALERTRIAYERTMMAWVRTAMSLITFGFTVYKFFQFELSKTDFEIGIFGPREFGLALIAIGLIALAVGKLEHRRDLHRLRQDYAGMPLSGTRLTSALVAALGAAAFIAVIFKV